jgi:hypothetical protein
MSQVHAAPMRAVLSVLLSLLFTFTACSNGADLELEKNAKRPGGDNDSFEKKPIPDLEPEDRRLVIFEELLRTQTSLSNMNKRGRKKHPCLEYNSFQDDDGISEGVFLFANYRGCSWDIMPGSSGRRYRLDVSGLEQYYRQPARKRDDGSTETGFVKSTAHFEVKVIRLKNPSRLVAVKKLRRSVKQNMDSGNEKWVRVDASWGEETSIAQDHWQSSIEGKWSFKDKIRLEPGASLQLSYRPSSTEKKSEQPGTQLFVKATEQVQFSDSCGWPVRGKFRWNERSTDGTMNSGVLEVSPQGFRNEGASTWIAWPERCL